MVYFVLPIGLLCIIYNLYVFVTKKDAWASLFIELGVCVCVGMCVSLMIKTKSSSKATQIFKRRQNIRWIGLKLFLNLLLFLFLSSVLQFLFLCLMYVVNQWFSQTPGIGNMSTSDQLSMKTVIRLINWPTYSYAKCTLLKSQLILYALCIIFV